MVLHRKLSQRCGWLALACLACGCSTGANAPDGSGAAKAPANEVAPPAAVDLEALRPQVVAFCGDCHALPPPSSFVKQDWPKEVALGMELYRLSGRFDLREPPQQDVIAFYQAQAPDKMEYNPPPPPSHPLGIRFRTEVVNRQPGEKRSAVADLRWQPPRGLDSGKLLFSELQRGEVSEIRFARGKLSVSTLAGGGFPALLEPADLDADGRVDYLVGDMGNFLPAEDHAKGRVLWLRPDSSLGWKTEVLAEGLGRVAHAVSGDFDQDGELDILVAEFGWRTTGRILLLRRTTESGEARRYEQIVVDRRHGASHLRPIDWDQDGDLDFVALISQEHEKVELFLNDGSGAFQTETLFAADDPAFGSSGMELVDLDGDGDLDVLLTNGDSMDSGQLKPYHAVHWLENEGKFPFTRHVLTTLPGAYRAIAADFDGDGDLDVAAFASTPLGTAPESWPSKDLLLLLEQTSPGQFVRHVLPSAVGGVALAAGDFDEDGDLDFAAGALNEGPDQTLVTIWWNEGPHDATPSAAP